MVSYALLVIFFTYFYTAVTFNPVEVANNMRKNGGFIPGLRPGRPTAEYLDRILTRITLAGAIFLAFIAVLPYVMSAITQMPWPSCFSAARACLIVVGVALDTMKQIEAHLLMRHYEGFMKYRRGGARQVRLVLLGFRARARARKESFCPRSWMYRNLHRRHVSGGDQFQRSYRREGQGVYRPGGAGAG